MYAFCSFTGYRAYRHREEGTWFIKTLTKNLTDAYINGNTPVHMLDILTEVHRQVAENRGIAQVSLVRVVIYARCVVIADALSMQTSLQNVRVLVQRPISTYAVLASTTTSGCEGKSSMSTG